MQRNQVVIEGVVKDMGKLRYTPGGVAALEFALAHRSTQSEAGGSREVECELQARALGEIAVELARLTDGTAIALNGFLARKSVHSGVPLLHVNKFKLI